MSRASILVFFLQYGIAASLVTWLPLWGICSWAGRHIAGKLRARALRRRIASRLLEGPLEGDFAEDGVRVEGHSFRIEGVRCVHGSPPRIGERVLVWGEARLGDDGVAYRSATRLLAAPAGGCLEIVVKSNLERWSPSRARSAALGLPFAAALWMAAWSSVQPWIMSRIVIAPSMPAREELARTMAGERPLAPILVGLSSPLAHARVRRAAVDALNRASDDDSPLTSDEIRALLPIVDALGEVGDEARVRTSLEAGEVRRAVEEGHRTDNADGRDLAARAALTFGFFHDAVVLSSSARIPNEDPSRVMLAAMAGDLGTVRDAAPPASCVQTWARVRLGEASVEDLRLVVDLDVSEAAKAEWRTLRSPRAALCSKLLSDVSLDAYEHLRDAPNGRFTSLPTLWWVLLSSENGLPTPQPPWGAFAFRIPAVDVESHGASPRLVDELVTKNHDIPAEWLESVHALRDSYEKRFVPPDECPSKLDLRYAGDVVIGQCLGRREAIDPFFLGEGVERDGQWASWWQRMFTSRCLAPALDHGSRDGWFDFDAGSEMQCLTPPIDDDGWSSWWRARARPCPMRTSGQAAYGDLAAALVEGLSIAKCAGMTGLETELHDALASLQAALDRRETMALLWP